MSFHSPTWSATYSNHAVPSAGNEFITMTSFVPSGFVIVTVKSGWNRSTWMPGETQKLIRNCWLTPMVVGLKLRCADVLTVALTTAPAGSCPVVGCLAEGAA